LRAATCIQLRLRRRGSSSLSIEANGRCKTTRIQLEFRVKRPPTEAAFCVADPSSGGLLHLLKRTSRLSPCMSATGHKRKSMLSMTFVRFATGEFNWSAQHFLTLLILGIRRCGAPEPEPAFAEGQHRARPATSSKAPLRLRPLQMFFSFFPLGFEKRLGLRAPKNLLVKQYWKSAAKHCVRGRGGCKENIRGKVATRMSAISRNLQSLGDFLRKSVPSPRSRRLATLMRVGRDEPINERPLLQFY
jgi:hypothetical protein